MFRREIPRPFILPQAYIITLEESDKEEVIDQEGKSFPKEVSKLSKLSKELSTKYKDWLKPASPRASPRGLSEFPQEELSFQRGTRAEMSAACLPKPMSHQGKGRPRPPRSGTIVKSLAARFTRDPVKNSSLPRAGTTTLARETREVQAKLEAWSSSPRGC